MLDPTFPIQEFHSPLLGGESPLPSDLWSVDRAPTQLYIQGHPEALSLLNRLPSRGLAVVGTRRCQQRSRELVRRVLRELRGFDLIIVSGLALGIDTEAHQSAIEAGLPTIAIQASGPDICYPARNLGLRTKILESGGLIVSELPPGTPPRPAQFIHRNRLIAGWTAASWIVEASFRSGALNTARWARDQDRHCFTTTGWPGDRALAGNLNLLLDTEAHPFLGTRSLGRVWLELESFLAVRSLLPANLPLLDGSTGDPLLLQKAVASLIPERGTATLTHLLSWSETQGWAPPRLIAALEQALASGSLIQTFSRGEPVTFGLPMG